MAEKKKPRSLKGILLAVVAGLLVFLGTLLGECGFGTGLGIGLGPGLGIGVRGPAAPGPSGATGSASAAVGAAPAPSASAGAKEACALRLDKSGLSLEGKPSDISAVVDACRKLGKAELVTTGDAVYGDLERLRAALHEAGVYTLERAR